MTKFYKDNSLGLVHQFHEAMGIEIRSEPGSPDKQTCLLRLQLIQEELSELAHGLASDNMVECLDALADLRYVIDGTVLALGLQDVFSVAFDEVHRSNMTKLDGSGRPYVNEAGRVVKGPNFDPPRLSAMMEFNYPHLYNPESFGMEEEA